MKIFISCVLLAVLSAAAQTKTAPSWPNELWPKTTLQAVGLDEAPLAAIDADNANGKYYLVDSMQVFRCGQLAYQRKYSHDYGKIYYKEAHTKGPLNARLTGPYNYFDPEWHPYYHGTDEHTMQSVSKTVSSAIFGVAVTRGDFKASLDTSVLKYFASFKVANVDDRKRRMTLRHVLTMTTGLDWNEDVAYDDPRNACSQMEATDDWVQFVIDRPMSVEPGTKFVYSSGATELLAYIFKKETGQDIEEYGRKYLFAPLGITHYYWKRNPNGMVDTEGGLFLSAEDLAKIGYLFLQGGKWDGQTIISTAWISQSLTPFVDAGEVWKYGFQWWLLPQRESQPLAWAAMGLGGQRLLLVPERDLVLVFTGWNILAEPADERELLRRILPAVHPYPCPAALK